MEIRETDPRTPDVRGLLADYHAFVRTQYPEEACFLLDVDALREPQTTFLAAWDGETCLGVGAVRIAQDHAELKSMYTRPEARGKGIAFSMVAALEKTAREKNRDRVMIETGPKFAAAMALYERAGYARRGAFGSYEDNPYSVFYEKHLPALA